MFTYIMKDPVYVVHVVLQSSRGREYPDATRTLEHFLSVVPLLHMLRQIADLFKCHPTRFPVLVDVFTCIVEDSCDEVHVMLQVTLV